MTHREFLIEYVVNLATGGNKRFELHVIPDTPQQRGVDAAAEAEAAWQTIQALAATPHKFQDKKKPPPPPPPPVRPSDGISLKQHPKVIG